MLADNTNSLVWVGVAVGVVAALGIAAMVLFPNVLDGVKEKVQTMIDNFSNGSQKVSDYGK